MPACSAAADALLDGAVAALLATHDGLLASLLLVEEDELAVTLRGHDLDEVLERHARNVLSALGIGLDGVAGVPGM